MAAASIGRIIIGAFWIIRMPSMVMVASRLQFYIRTNRSAVRRLFSMLQPPPGPLPGFSLGYQTKIHLVMAAIRLQSSCKWTKRRAT